MGKNPVAHTVRIQVSLPEEAGQLLDQLAEKTGMQRGVLLAMAAVTGLRVIDKALDQAMGLTTIEEAASSLGYAVGRDLDQARRVSEE